MLRAHAVAIALAFASSTNACCGSASRTKAVTGPGPCPARPELRDELDSKTGLAPIPRQLAGSSAKPSGNIYWRQMRAVPIMNLQHVEKLVVQADKACAEARESAVSCWRLPFAQGQALVLEREPQQVITELPSSELEALSNEPRPEVPSDVRAALSRGVEVAQIEVGPKLACARLVSGRVRCLDREKPRIPPSASDFSTAPTQVRDIAGREINARVISVGGAACAITQDEQVVCWGHIPQAAAFPACDGQRASE
jgi:hypothetical protein